MCVMLGGGRLQVLVFRRGRGEGDHAAEAGERVKLSAT